MELEALRLKAGVPGLGAALLSDSRTQVWAAGVRKVESTAKIETTDKFHIGSCTKAMTATLVAIFIENQQLSWSSTLGELFPGLQIHKDFKNVTIEMLTAHRSGITNDVLSIDSGNLWLSMRESGNKNEDVRIARSSAVEKILSLSPLSPPGSQYLYSNWNYIIAGAILEKISGQAWETLMQEKLFTPLKMTSCGFGSAADPLLPNPNQPWPHRLSNNQVVSVLPDVFSDNPKSFGPAGTVHCSLQDWGSFLQSHLDGSNGKDTPILAANSFKKLHTGYKGQEYTAGGWLRLERSWLDGFALQHTGSNTYNFANVWLLPKNNVGIMVATNTGDENLGFNTTDTVVAALLKSILPR